MGQSIYFLTTVNFHQQDAQTYKLPRFVSPRFSASDYKRDYGLTDHLNVKIEAEGMAKLRIRAVGFREYLK